MTIETCLSEIESREFSARLNMASDAGTFLRAMNAEPAVAELSRLLTDAPSLDRVAERVMELAHLTVEAEYERPHDVALAVYAWVVNGKNQKIGRILANELRGTSQTWWGEHISRTILVDQNGQRTIRTKSSSGTQFFENIKRDHRVVVTRNTTLNALLTPGLLTRVPIHFTMPGYLDLGTPISGTEPAYDLDSIVAAVPTSIGTTTDTMKVAA